MTVKDIVERMGLEIFSGEDGLNREVSGGYTSDLLSDVMGYARKGSLWITLHSHRNIIGVASLKELSAIVLVKGYVPDRDTILVSDSEGIPVLGSKQESFELSGKLYELFL